VIRIPRRIFVQMVVHTMASLPNEACGVLAGGEEIEKFYPMANADNSTTTYRLDRDEQFEVFTDIDKRGRRLLGIFHSHPHTNAYPSDTDRRQALYPVPYLILSGPELRAFVLKDDDFVEEEVTIGE
jgi:[CysO sulfur-carrier protein]-S-L-cysteine hydrolase